MAAEMRPLKLFSSYNFENYLSVVTVVLLTVAVSSLDSNGVFQFSDSSLNVITHEIGDIGYNTESLSVTRTEGSTGNVTVNWAVVPETGGDLVDNVGSVHFLDGQDTADLIIKIAGDQSSELDERFNISLTNSTMGRLGDGAKLTAILTIGANDDPYGLFSIATDDKFTNVAEDNVALEFRIQRLYGSLGDVRVHYKTLIPDENYEFLPQNVMRADTNDFEFKSDSVIFPANDNNKKEIEVKIKADDIIEPDESIFIILTSVELVRGAQAREVRNSPQLAPSSFIYAQVNIYGTLFTAAVGDQYVYLSCSFVGNSAETNYGVYWYKITGGTDELISNVTSDISGSEGSTPNYLSKGRILSYKFDYVSEEQIGLASLKIPDIKACDHSQYKCYVEAKTQNFNKESPLQLDVQYTGQYTASIISTINITGSFVIMKGSNFRIGCTSSKGFPVPELTWEKRDVSANVTLEWETWETVEDIGPGINQDNDTCLLSGQRWLNVNVENRNIKDIKKYKFKYVCMLNGEELASTPIISLDFSAAPPLPINGTAPSLPTNYILMTVTMPPIFAIINFN